MSRKKRNAKSTRSAPRPRRFEGLEARTLLAADLAVVADLPSPVDPVPVDNVVVVRGTDEADVIRVYVEGERLNVAVNGELTQYDNSEIDYIHIHALGGDDHVGIARSVLQSTWTYAGDGNDTVRAGSGNDYVEGGRGNDRIGGGYGHDLLVGGPGNDILAGQVGNDALLGGEGDDSVRGGAGDDAMAGGTGNDRLNGGIGNDWIFGDATNHVPDDYAGLVDYAIRYGNRGNGNDSIDGGAGADIIIAAGGDDTINAGRGNDLVLAGRGNDGVRGGAGKDVVFAGWGADKVDGGYGNDVIVGDPSDQLPTDGDGPAVEPVWPASSWPMPRNWSMPSIGLPSSTNSSCRPTMLARWLATTMCCTVLTGPTSSSACKATTASTVVMDATHWQVALVTMSSAAEPITT